MKLHQIFSDNAVFAANQPLRIFGEGEGAVTVSFSTQTVRTEAVNGKWCAELSPMDCGGPYTLTVSGEGENQIRQNIYIGKVYLVAGQSNMQFKMQASTCTEADYEENSLLRLFTVERLEDGEPHTPDDGWVVCQKDDIKNWTAIGYLVGSHIAKKKNTAVGIIACYQGASIIESWLPPGAVQKEIGTLSLSEKHPDHSCEPYSLWNRDGILYEKAFKSIVPYAVSGVVWYQGESDTSAAEGAIYDKELCLLIDTWRRDLMNESLPFVVVSLANLEDETIDHIGWKAVQAAQEKVSSMRNLVTTVAAADICETNDIHPPTKKKLAQRIADALLNM